jgi:hypothetical protein
MITHMRVPGRRRCLILQFLSTLIVPNLLASYNRATLITREFVDTQLADIVSLYQRHARYGGGQGCSLDIEH